MGMLTDMLGSCIDVSPVAVPVYFYSIHCLSLYAFVAYSIGDGQGMLVQERRSKDPDMQIFSCQNRGILVFIDDIATWTF